MNGILNRDRIFIFCTVGMHLYHEVHLLLDKLEPCPKLIYSVYYCWRSLISTSVWHELFVVDNHFTKSPLPQKLRFPQNSALDKSVEWLIKVTIVSFELKFRPDDWAKPINLFMSRNCIKVIGSVKMRCFQKEAVVVQNLFFYFQLWHHWQRFLTKVWLRYHRIRDIIPRKVMLEIKGTRKYGSDLLLRRNELLLN